jgi:hypothetical protein
MENIIKNNVEIALCMGMEFTPTKAILLDKTVKPQRAFKPEDLDYHKNYNSLMKVVERAENNYWIFIDGLSVVLLSKNNSLENGKEFKEKTKIKSIYNAMVFLTKKK